MAIKRLPLVSLKKQAQNPAETQQKAKARRHIDLMFLMILLVLVGFGLTMLFSASYAYSYYWEGNSFYYITRQLIYAAVGFAGMIVLSFLDYHLFRRFAYLLYAVAIVLLLIVFAMPALNGARRWILLGFTTFQPSEVAKFAIIVVFAKLIEQNQDRMKTFKGGVLPFILPLGLVVGLVVMEPHVSGTILILSIALAMMLIGGTNLAFFGLGERLWASAWESPLCFLTFLTMPKAASTCGSIHGWILPIKAFR